MRIAILAEMFYPDVGGCERRFLEIGTRLVKRGHEVHVFSTQSKKELSKTACVNGVIVHRYTYSKDYLKLSNFRSISGVLKYSVATVFKLLSKGDFDIYYLNQWPIMHSMFVRPFFAPIIQEWCEVWLNKIVVFERIISKIMTYNVAVSDFTKRRLVRFLGVPSERIMVIPNGVEYKKFSANKHKKRWGKIVYVGRLSPHKHIDMLVDAFYKVKKRIPEAELHLIGSGLLLQLIKKRASKLDSCFVYGFLPEDQMLDILKSSWLFVSLSEREGSGIASLEAMAAGTPVITTDYPDNAAKELITSVRSGIVVQPNISDLVSAILKVYSDEESWKEMSNNAHLFAMKNDWDAIASQIESYFYEIRSKYDRVQGNYS